MNSDKFLMGVKRFEYKIHVIINSLNTCSREGENSQNEFKLPHKIKIIPTKKRGNLLEINFE